MTFHHYILGPDNEPIAVSLLAWATWLQLATDERRVDETFVDGVRISTVFLGLDHNFMQSGPPILFETMIFAPGDEELDQETWRYPTWKQAERGHTAAVAAVRKRLAACGVNVE